jgi:hypothetical protein
MKEQSRKRVYLSKATCPSCGEKGALRKIIYGMPGADFDFEKYIVGGCCVTEIDSEIGCSNCEWQGMRSDCIQQILESS